LETRYDPESSRTAIVDIMRRVPEHAWNKLLSGAYGGDVRDQLGNLRVPTLIVHDPGNDYIPVEAAHLLHEQILDSELDVTEEYAAFPLREGAYLTIDAFIEKVARSGTP
jgi:pimeloyl-ACP methyl ester carboxylesterase